MNIHIIPNQKFTQKFCDLIENYYPANSNKIYIYGNRDYDIMNNDCLIFIDEVSTIQFNELKKADKIFVHGFYNSRLIKFLYKNRRCFKKNKLVLIIWGADLYNNRFLLQDKKLHIKTRYIEFLKRIVIRKANLFMTFASPDFELAKKWFGASGRQFDCLYPSNADQSQLDNLRNNYKKTKNTVRVLLGNSATDTNNHFEALDWISRFKNEDIEIVCPLSYGDKEYGKKVIEYGNKIFGMKFIPVEKYMSPERYSELLNSVDIAIFNHNRQQGTGNIEILAYLGKKIYMKSNISSWGHYVLRDKCRFFDVEVLKNCTFEEFCEFDEIAKVNNIKYFEKIWDINYIKSLWDNVINF